MATDLRKEEQKTESPSNPAASKEGAPLQGTNTDQTSKTGQAKISGSIVADAVTTTGQTDAGTQGYYTTAKRKIVDFFIGFLGLPLAILIVFYGLSLLSGFIMTKSRIMQPILILISFMHIAIMLLAVYVLYYFFKHGRRLIPRGFFVALILTPLIIFGLIWQACSGGW
jgi:hypothetical protein